MNEQEPYKYWGVELSPAAAMPLIKEIMADGRPVHRAVLARRVAELHRSRGGKSGGNDVFRIKKALAELRAAGEAFNVNHGHWRLPVDGEPAPDTRIGDENAIDGDDDGGILEVEAEGARLVVEREIGSGPETVYVYCYERDKRLARYENQPTWPCKIGFSAGDFEGRILGQGVGTAIHSLPNVGLVIRTGNGRLIERAIHDALRLARRAVPQSLGSEWFETTPDAVAQWFEAYVVSLGLLAPAAAAEPTAEARR